MDLRWWLRFLAGFAVLYGVLAGLAEFDATGRFGLVILAGVLATAVAVEWVLDGTRPAESVRRLGLGRPGGRALLVAIVVSALVLLTYPLAAVITDAAVVLRSGWPWLLIGIFAFHGVAEELVWRGYAFRRLRAGRSFGRAVAWTMPLLAATHVPVLVNSGPRSAERRCSSRRSPRCRSRTCSRPAAAPSGHRPSCTPPSTASSSSFSRPPR